MGLPNNHREEEAMGNSSGGLSTKLPAAVAALGNPVRLPSGPGQGSEMRRGEALREGLASDYVIADQGDDADAFLDSSRPAPPR